MSQQRSKVRGLAERNERAARDIDKPRGFVDTACVLCNFREVSRVSKSSGAVDNSVGRRGTTAVSRFRDSHIAAL